MVLCSIIMWKWGENHNTNANMTGQAIHNKRPISGVLCHLFKGPVYLDPVVRMGEETLKDVELRDHLTITVTVL